MANMNPHHLLDRIGVPAERAPRDPHDMLALIEGFPAQLQVTTDFATTVAKVAAHGPPANVVVAGVGGSATGGDVARVLMDAAGSVPCVVWRDYGLPEWVGPNTLVVCVSYSGNTDETLSAFSAAVSARARILAVTAGGALAAGAREHAAPLAQVPGGQPPRTATGMLVAPILFALEQAGVLSLDVAAGLAQAEHELLALSVRLGATAPVDSNPSKQLALALHGRLPVIYGAHRTLGAAAARWKAQINENAKQPAFDNVLPEQNHNEILAWTRATKIAPRWSVVWLETGLNGDALTREARIRITSEIIAEAAHVHRVSPGVAGGLLAQLLALFLYGDYVSYYLAILNGVCPTEIGAIEDLKVRLVAEARNNRPAG